MKCSMRSVLHILVLVFALNLFWESLQSFLFIPHTTGFLDFLFVHVKASAGDVIMVAFLLTLDALVFSRYVGHGTRICLMVISGSALAIIVEHSAIATGRWAYGQFMPIVPFLGVGLVPILQMMIIPPILAHAWKLLSALREHAAPRV